jgi:hypothetical protein
MRKHTLNSFGKKPEELSPGAEAECEQGGYVGAKAPTP